MVACTKLSNFEIIPQALRFLNVIIYVVRTFLFSVNISTEESNLCHELGLLEILKYNVRKYAELKYIVLR